MSAMKIIQALGRKIAAKKQKTPEGITQIQPQIYAESEAGRIAETLVNAGLPLERFDDFIRSEADVVRILNQIKAIEKKNLAENIRGGITSTKSAKIFNTAGEELDPSKPIIGGTQEGKKINQDFFIRDAEIKTRLEKQNKENVAKIRQRMVDEAIDNSSPGFAGDIKYDAQLVADDLAERMGKTFDDLSQKEQITLYDQAYQGLSKQRFKNRKKPSDADDPGYDDEPADFDPDADNETFAKGGIARLGFKDGMTRRTFLKLLGGMAAVPIVGKFFKLAKVGKTVTKVPIIKTGDVPGKPEWFDALVNKVILEGDDVTKRFATQERQVVHMKKIDDETSVTVTQDLNDGSIMVDVDDPIRNVMGESGDDTSLQMLLKKNPGDESSPAGPDEFSFTEADMRNYMDGPDDYTTEFVENTVNKMSDLTSDLGKIKSYATGKKPTMKQIVESKKRKDMVELAERNPAEYAAGRGPDGPDFPEPDDFASGGIARMLGE